MPTRRGRRHGVPCHRLRALADRLQYAAPPPQPFRRTFGHPSPTRLSMSDASPASADPVAAPSPAASTAPSPSAPPPPPPPASAPPPSAAARGRGRRGLLVAVLLLAMIATGATIGWWTLRHDLDLLRDRLAEAQRGTAMAVEQSAQRDRDAQLRIERLESELSRVRDQRAELDALYLDLTRGRDESALVEVERLVTLAAQELQISGSVATALAALSAADARLARIDRPQLVNLRRAITRDVERLRAAPSIDVTGLALKIDQLAQGSETLPLLADAGARPAAPVAAGAGKTAVKADAKTAAGSGDDGGTWARVRTWLQQEFGDLVRIREVDTPEALLLTGAQQQLVRQQLKLRLLNARQALLARNDRLYRADLASATELLTRYFDTRQAATVTVQTQLRQLAAAPLSVDVPQIGDSLAALNALRGGARPPR